MNNLKEFIEKPKGLHQKITRDVTKGKLTTLRCNQCGRVRTCSAQDFGDYLKSGWPKCCDYTMELRRAS